MRRRCLTEPSPKNSQRRSLSIADQRASPVSLYDTNLSADSEMERVRTCFKQAIAFCSSPTR